MQNSYDVLVIGSGSAGLSIALKAAAYGAVGLITKQELQESNTRYAQGGIASVLDSEDSFEQHIRDTMEAGAGLNNHKAVELIVREGPRVIGELMEFGARFTERNGSLHLSREGGHSHDRIVHAADMTGQEVQRVLVEQARQHPNIDLMEHHFALELLTEHHLGKAVTRYDELNCFGAYAFDTRQSRVKTLLAKATVLATGGAGQVYKYTTNPSIATGDGIAMAYRAKARIANMEFIQFHPTALCHPDADSFLISEAVRGHGGILRNKDGEAFMSKYDDRKELAPRDIVARAIDDQLKKRGENCVYLDVTHLDADKVKTTFPNIYETCLGFGIDITRRPIPVVPAAHYTCGGVNTDLSGRTSINRLFACGETAHTGVHGANRLASNSLLEALVFADRAAHEVQEIVEENNIRKDLPDWDDTSVTNTEEWVLVSHNEQELKQVMWDYVGIMRSTLRLERAMRRVKLLYEEVEDFYDRTRVSVPLCQLRNLIGVASLIVRSALKRRESRGLHYTSDFPETRDSEKNNTII